MHKSEKKLKALATILKKDNYLLISEAINLLRNEQPFEGAISALTSFYGETDDWYLILVRQRSGSRFSQGYFLP